VMALFQSGAKDPLGTWDGSVKSAELTPGNYFVQLAGSVADSTVGKGTFTFSVAAHNPEPAEWMLMLCGLVVAGFIARRKIGLAAG